MQYFQRSVLRGLSGSRTALFDLLDLTFALVMFSAGSGNVIAHKIQIQSNPGHQWNDLLFVLGDVTQSIDSI